MTLPYVSPSQMDTFTDCNRKWYFQSVVGIKPPSSASAQLGTAVHAALEAFVLDGKTPDERTKSGAIAAAGIPYARHDPTRPLVVELDMAQHPAHRLTLAGVPIAGRIDLIDPHADPLLIQDWKTTTDFKWAKTEGELRKNTQAIWYSRFAIDLYGRDKARFRHVTLLTTGKPEVQETGVTLTRSEIASAFDAYTPKVERMIATAPARDASEVAPTLTACMKYGGCFFRERCRSMGDRLRIFADPASHTPSHVVPAQEDTVNPALAALAKLKQQKAAADAAPATPTPTPPALSAGAGRGQIVPPDAPSDLPARRADWPEEAKADFEERAGIREHDGKQPRLVAEAAAEKEIRKRAKKAAPVEDTLPVTPPPALPVEDTRPAVAEPVKPSPLDSTPPAPSLALYIDCFPQRGVAEVIPLEDYVADFQAQVAKEAGVPIYSLVEYGKGPSLVAAKLAKETPVGNVYVNSRLPCSAACLEVLLPLADTVVRGH